MTTWGLTATVLGPTEEILQFAAYHLEQGAHRIYLYLDAENLQAQALLKSHPKIRVTTCDAGYWAKRQGGKPKKHQVRQTFNASRSYRNNQEVDWLIHMDLDEFLVPETGIVADLLSMVAQNTQMTRIRPMELLSGGNDHFKSFIAGGPKRDRIMAQLYPTYGAYLKAGFLSHLAGKVFLRTGLENVDFRIHNAFQNGEMIEGVDHQPGMDLAHLHAKSWEDWLAHYRFRMAQGSYRAELAPNRPRDKGGLNMNDVFALIEAEQGEAGLRVFFDEVCADSPDLRSRLAEFGLLKRANLGLKATLSTHFPSLPG